MSAILTMPESLRTKNGVRSACTAVMIRMSLNWPSSASCASMMLVMPTSTSPRPTIGLITWSPAVGCTSMLMPPLSFITLEMAEAVVWLSVPGGSVAKP